MFHEAFPMFVVINTSGRAKIRTNSTCVDPPNSISMLETGLELFWVRSIQPAPPPAQCEGTLWVVGRGCGLVPRTKAMEKL